jgi:serine/threonine-protein kinase
MPPPPPISGIRLGELLGEGTSGTVYAAVNKDGDEIAVKFLRESLAEDPEMVVRFRREASVAQKLRSEFIAQVVSAGRSGERYWIAYRRLHGETLARRLQRETALAPASFVPLIEQVLRGLAVAHDAGVIHRDMKPANIMIERPPKKGGAERACIMDFGISKSPTGGSGTFQHSLTSATATLGTINYMPPEQVGGSAGVDHRADLYAVAVVAYRGLSGRLPYVGTSQAAVLHAKLNEDPRSLATSTGVKWPQSIEAFFEQSLAREPTGRFGNAAAMATAWRHAMEGEAMPAVEALRKASVWAGDSEHTMLEGPGSTR